jgi:hypothetical protein
MTFKINANKIIWFQTKLTSYRGERFQVPTRITTVTRQTGEYKVDLTCHPKFPFAFEEITIAFEVN